MNIINICVKSNRSIYITNLKNYSYSNLDCMSKNCEQQTLRYTLAHNTTV